MFFPIHNIGVTLKTKNVNNKRIFHEIDNMVMDVVKMDLAALSHADRRLDLVELLEDVLYEMAQVEPTLSTINIILDDRNNSPQDRKRSVVNMSITYQQSTCVNTTELAYSFSL